MYSLFQITKTTHSEIFYEVFNAHDSRTRNVDYGFCAD